MVTGVLRLPPGTVLYVQADGIGKLVELLNRDLLLCREEDGVLVPVNPDTRPAGAYHNLLTLYAGNDPIFVRVLDLAMSSAEGVFSRILRRLGGGRDEPAN